MKHRVELDGRFDREQLERELSREKHKRKYRTVLRSTVYTLVVVAALAILAAVLWMPVLRIYGSSMTPTLSEGQIVVSVKGSHFEHGDVVGVYYGSKLLVKRCIATAGEWVDIDDNGNVYVNNQLLDEPYVVEKDYGQCDLVLPYQVPENAIFVMGDHRATSIDSRSKSVGCIDMEDVVGRIVLRVWPLNTISIVH